MKSTERVAVGIWIDRTTWDRLLVFQATQLCPDDPELAADAVEGNYPCATQAALAEVFGRGLSPSEHDVQVFASKHVKMKGRSKAWHKNDIDSFIQSLVRQFKFSPQSQLAAKLGITASDMAQALIRGKCNAQEIVREKRKEQVAKN